MRYTALIMITLSLMACNLSTGGGGSPLPTQATPTAIPTDPPIQTGNISYWQVLPHNEVEVISGDVLLDSISLRHTESDTARTGTSTIDVENSLQALLDNANFWDGSNVIVESVTVSDGLATVQLNGQIGAAGGLQLTIASLQFLLTVLDNEGIDRTLIQINGQNIGNIGISHSSQAVPEDHIYERDSFYASLQFAP